jgi:hypothetical protein
VAAYHQPGSRLVNPQATAPDEPIGFAQDLKSAAFVPTNSVVTETKGSPRIGRIPAERLGIALQWHREEDGASLHDIARRLDYSFTPTVLGMIEAGRYPLAESQIDELLRCYRVDPVKVMPDRHKLDVDDERRYMAVGWKVVELKYSSTSEGLLTEYLAFVYDLRHMKKGSRIPLRQDDLPVLAETIDWPLPDVIAFLLGLMDT